jgi:hypothetical protein
MPHRHNAGSKPQRERKRATAAKPATSERSKAQQDFVRHPLFGAIPLVDASVRQPDGSLFHYRDYDPNYAPPLPKGAVRGDVRSQSFCRMCHLPRYFYVDVPRRCVDCGADFVFAAAEQKHWYETLKFHFDSVPPRCVGCRRKRRSEKSLQQALSEATARARREPDSSAAQLALAEAILRYREKTARGRIDAALAAARKARRLLKGHSSSEAADADFWEGLGLALAGHVSRAAQLFERFLENARAGRGGAPRIAEARRWLGTALARR